MRKLAITAVVSLFASFNTLADDFDAGSVIILCEAPDEASQISTEVFNEAFPQWMISLQIHANEGRVARAHYLSNLKEGIFIVVPGENRKAAMAQALEIQSENQRIMHEALEKAGLDKVDVKDACQLIEIGPVAITPIK